jgi:hypothetical protein
MGAEALAYIPIKDKTVRVFAWWNIAYAIFLLMQLPGLAAANASPAKFAGHVIAALACAALATEIYQGSRSAVALAWNFGLPIWSR